VRLFGTPRARPPVFLPFIALSLNLPMPGHWKNSK
jgi:hypothetical protein